MNNFDKIGTLYIVATPIGNLEDITLRAIRILNEVDFILCEDTRTTNKLLQKYNIKNKTVSYNSHTTDSKNNKIINELLEGKNVALVSDAGTPGISDPGSFLVNLIKNNVPGFKIVPIPGASAISAIWSVSGLFGNEFYFKGFVPQKKGRETFLKNIVETKEPVIVYESGHRVLKFFDFFINTNKKFIIGRELTKIFETVFRGDAIESINYLNKNQTNLKGEFTIIIHNE